MIYRAISAVLIVSIETFGALTFFYFLYFFRCLMAVCGKVKLDNG